MLSPSSNIAGINCVGSRGTVGLQEEVKSTKRVSSSGTWRIQTTEFSKWHEFHMGQSPYEVCAPHTDDELPFVLLQVCVCIQDTSLSSTRAKPAYWCRDKQECKASGGGIECQSQTLFAYHRRYSYHTAFVQPSFSSTVL